MTGRLIAVVGPSGVGKDSVIAGIAAAWPAIGLVRRTITRPAELGGEDFDAVTPETFARMRASGAFCLSWSAHGLLYGLPADLVARVAAGNDCLANLSRGVLTEAAATFPGLLALELSASPDTLAGRLAGRAREGNADIGRRLARRSPPLPPDLPVIRLSNDGPLEETVARAIAALRDARTTASRRVPDAREWPAGPKVDA